MKVIDDREERTVKRKIAKKKFDSLITLANNPRYKEVQRIRLLDEGAVVMDEGEVAFIIAKGTMERALNKMPDTYENYVDLGHMDFATFPIPLGIFRKSDLHLVNIGGGRKALDVDVRLNYKNPLVQALQTQPFDLAVSARFSYRINEDMTKEVSELLGYYVEVIDDIDIINYAIVGEPGNVNSDGLKLKGGVKPVGKLNEMTLDALAEALEAVIGEEPNEEPAEDLAAVAEETTEEPTEEQAEAQAEEAAEEPAQELAAEEPAEEPEEDAEDVLAALAAQLTELREEVASLRAELTRRDAELATSKKAYGALASKIKSMSVQTEKTERTVTDEPVYTDGFGE